MGIQVAQTEDHRGLRFSLKMRTEAIHTQKSQILGSLTADSLVGLSSS